MEHVTVLPTPQNLAERTADALNWLALVTAPSNGPLGAVLSTIRFLMILRPL